MSRWFLAAAPVVVVAAVACSQPAAGPTDPQGPDTPPATPADLAREGEVHLAEIRQLTRGAGENAEAYWSFDGSELIFQSTREPYECDQIMRIKASGGEPELVSTGTGRTTCGYFTPGDRRVIWSSTHLAGDECPPRVDMSQGYVWPLYSSYDIFSSDPDGGNLVRLTESPTYDAEATVCPVDGSIIFTSTRDGDLELYRMDADGNNVVRLTSTPGYDGGAFFSADCKQIVWRASRPTGEALADYQRLLAQNLVRPSRLEIWVADADGSNARQVTYLGAASFAPYFHPSGDRILFSTNHPDPRGREFDIWSIGVDGTGLERITTAEGFDGFPMFSPDGTRLAFASNRNQANPGETDVYVARWVEEDSGARVATAADRFAADVAYLAGDELGGRGVGTPGLRKAADYIVSELGKIGVEGAWGEGAYGQPVEVATAVSVGDGTAVTIGPRAVAADQRIPTSFSASGKASGATVFVGYGISAPELGRDDYKGKRVKARIAVIRRFVPPGETFAQPEHQRRYSDLHYKAFLAREKGAVGVVFIDLPELAAGGKMPDEAPLPELSLARLKDVGIPAVVVTREAGAALARKSARVSLAVELERNQVTTYNIAGVIRAGAENKLPGAVVVGAHYDHLGMGGESSLEPGVAAPHNGADDNASGVAGLLEVARQLHGRRGELRRDVYLVAFTAEEMGLLGSSLFARELPGELAAGDVVAMLNMDMIGRMRGNTVAALGGETAAEWASLVPAACEAAAIRCRLSGDGYGPSDQTPFYAAKIPVLQFFTGPHGDYHKTTDDAHLVNAGGGARIATVVAGVGAAVANRPGELSYREVAAPLPAGDRRSWGASMGTIPDYADKGDVPGVLLSGVRPGGPAAAAGIQGGDRLTRIGKTEVRTVQDFVYVLQQAKPGERVPVELIRDGKKMTVKITFGESSRRRGR
jgi:Tol biopolymer transport system component